MLYLPHPVSSRHKQMSLHDRAAQFAPFAALNGHSAAIEETARLTDGKMELDSEQWEILSEKLQHIQKIPGVTITVTYFVPDSKKTGGRYVTVTGSMKKLDELHQEMKMTDGTVIPMDAIIDIQSELFTQL
ncbi:MAG: hypothetical protein HUJ58_01780 [Erysipelotrichaceae bacterium]|nr:hypothetical protein [Erysipelotrichaceae bacterium]